MGALYRVHQFWDAVRTPSLTSDDLRPAQRVLSEPQMALFSRLQPSEQAHGLRVLKTLQAMGENHPDLLTAALLHDIGKIQYQLHLWERVVIVLGKRFASNLVARWGNALPGGWKRPFVIATQHPTWGADLARQAGTSALAIRLIQNHQEDVLSGSLDSLENHLLSLLQKADDQN